MQAFIYTEFSAMDNVVRKGSPIKLETEKSSKARRDFLRIDNSDGFGGWKDQARISRDTDINLASQITNIALKNPNRTRIMAIFGDGHAPIKEYLPKELKDVCEVVRFDPGTSVPDSIRLMHDIQGGLEDDQIEARLNALVASDKL